MPEAFAAFPEKALFLLKPAPYKVLYGGRGAAKTWAFARALLILGYRRKLFILCARELQKSIADSVHKVLAEQIEKLRLDVPTPAYPQGFYKVTQNSIVGANGTAFTFAGVRNNVQAIKSMEGIDICAVFEATFVSEYSWEMLLPTVRRDAPFGPFKRGSEIWVEFNPELETDYTYKRWVLNPPSNAIVVDMNFRDNEWFPEFLRNQMEDMKRQDLENYMTIWEGRTRKALKGAVYAKELEQAITERRINPHVAYDKGRPLTVTFDLGSQDMTSMWFIQQVGMEHNVIDFYENNGHGIDHYINKISEMGYAVANIVLPHDGDHATQAARGKSIKIQVQQMLPNAKVAVVPAVRKATRINMLRRLFPRLSFNELRTSPGVLCLQHYHYGVDQEKGQRTEEPVHDWASHAADSLGHYAQWLREGQKDLEIPTTRGPRETREHGWMAL